MSKFTDKAKEIFMEELYDFCLQHETCSDCPMAETCFKSGLEQKFTVAYEDYLINKERLKMYEHE